MTHNPNPHTRPLRHVARIVGWTAYGCGLLAIGVIHARELTLLGSLLYSVSAATFATVTVAAILRRLSVRRVVLHYNKRTGEWSSPTGHDYIARELGGVNATPDVLR